MSAKPELAGQTTVVIGGSAGIGLETARLAREKGADVILTARDPDRLHRASLGSRCVVPIVVAVVMGAWLVSITPRPARAPRRSHGGAP